MKSKIFFILLFFHSTGNLFAQKPEIRTEYCGTCSLKKRIAVDMENFLIISNYSQEDFERFVLSIGYKYEIDKDFCCNAYQNSTSEEIMGIGQYFYFNKCEDRFYVMWQGKPEGSGFKDIIHRLKDYFYEESDGKKEYRFQFEGKKYTIYIDREINNSDNYPRAYETFLMFHNK